MSGAVGEEGVGVMAKILGGFRKGASKGLLHAVEGAGVGASLADQIGSGVISAALKWGGIAILADIAISIAKDELARKLFGNQAVDIENAALGKSSGPMSWVKDGAWGAAGVAVLGVGAMAKRAAVNGGIAAGAYRMVRKAAEKQAAGASGVAEDVADVAMAPMPFRGVASFAAGRVVGAAKSVTSGVAKMGMGVVRGGEALAGPIKAADEVLLKGASAVLRGGAALARGEVTPKSVLGGASAFVESEGGIGEAALSAAGKMADGVGRVVVGAGRLGMDGVSAIRKTGLGTKIEGAVGEMLGAARNKGVVGAAVEGVEEAATVGKKAGFVGQAFRAARVGLAGAGLVFGGGEALGVLEAGSLAATGLYEGAGLLKRGWQASRVFRGAAVMAGFGAAEGLKDVGEYLFGNSGSQNPDGAVRKTAPAQPFPGDARFLNGGNVRTIDAGTSMQIGAIDARVRAGNMAMGVGSGDVSSEAARPIAVSEGVTSDGNSFFVMGRKVPGSLASMSDVFSARSGPSGSAVSVERNIELPRGNVTKQAVSYDPSFTGQSDPIANPNGPRVLVLMPAGQVAAPVLGAAAGANDQIIDALGATKLANLNGREVQTLASPGVDARSLTSFTGGYRDGSQVSGVIDLSNGQGRLNILDAQGKTEWSTRLDGSGVSVDQRGNATLSGKALQETRDFIRDPAAARREYAADLSAGVGTPPAGMSPMSGPGIGFSGLAAGVGVSSSVVAPQVQPGPQASSPGFADEINGATTFDAKSAILARSTRLAGESPGFVNQAPVPSGMSPVPAGPTPYPPMSVPTLESEPMSRVIGGAYGDGDPSKVNPAGPFRAAMSRPIGGAYGSGDPSLVNPADAFREAMSRPIGGAFGIGDPSKVGAVVPFERSMESGVGAGESALGRVQIGVDPSFAGTGGRTNVVSASVPAGQLSQFEGRDSRLAAAAQGLSLGALSPDRTIGVVEGQTAGGASYFSMGLETKPDSGRFHNSVAVIADGTNSAVVGHSVLVGDNGVFARTVVLDEPGLASQGQSSDKFVRGSRVSLTDSGPQAMIDAASSARRPDQLTLALAGGDLKGINANTVQVGGTDARSMTTFSGKNPDGTNVSGAVELANGYGRMVIFGDDGKTPVWAKDISGSGVKMDRMGNATLSGADAGEVKGFLTDPRLAQISIGQSADAGRGFNVSSKVAASIMPPQATFSSFDGAASRPAPEIGAIGVPGVGESSSSGLSKRMSSVMGGVAPGDLGSGFDHLGPILAAWSRLGSGREQPVFAENDKSSGRMAQNLVKPDLGSGMSIG
jgi:hypothetical protein